MNSFRDRQAAIKKLRLLAFTPKSDVNTFRTKIEDTFRTVFIPNRVECVDHDYGGVESDLLIPEVYASRRIMLYIHGGSFVGGSRVSWRPFVATLANAASCRAVVPEFKLAPDHAFPAGLEDIQSVFRTLYTEEQVARSLDSSSTASDVLPEIIVVADGSGASLALALMFSLRGKFRASVRQLILFSPWLDISPDSPIVSSHKLSDEVMSGEVLKRCGEVYTFAANLFNPLVSPLKAAPEQFKDFPHVYIQAGEKEILLDDIQRFKSILDTAGIDCTVDVWPGMMHLFQMADEYLGESHLAIQKVGDMIAKIGISESSQLAEVVPGLKVTGTVVEEGSLMLEKSFHADA